MWTKAHDEFCMANSLRPSSQYLWRYLARQREANEEQELDLGSFNRWVKKHRGDGFDRKSLIEALDQLVRVGVVKSLKTYSWHTHKLICYDLKIVLAKKSRPKGFGKESRSRNPRRFKESSKNWMKQQQLENTAYDIGVLTSDAGFEFDAASLKEFALHGVEAVKAAIEHYRQRSLTGEIGNPEGWLRCCIRKSWADSVTDRSELTWIQQAVDRFEQLRDWLGSKGIVPSATPA